MQNKYPEMLRLLALLLTMMPYLALAQTDDELDQMMGKTLKNSKVYTFATFKASHLIMGHTVENLGKRHFDFRISHRFGKISDGIETFFGIDQAQVRLGLDYGVTDWLMLGVGRSTYEQTIDAYFKARFMRQSKGGKGAMPLTMSFLASAACRAQRWTDATVPDDPTNRFSYAFQLFMGRKFHERFSMQFVPTIVHRNLVPSPEVENTTFALGLGLSIKASRRIAITAEYYHILPGYHFNAKRYVSNMAYNSLSVGVDIETGGHVFQVHLTNSNAQFESGFIPATANSWGKGAILLGFNISRIFSTYRTPSTPDKTVKAAKKKK